MKEFLNAMLNDTDESDDGGILVMLKGYWYIAIPVVIIVGGVSYYTWKYMKCKKESRKFHMFGWGEKEASPAITDIQMSESKRVEELSASGAIASVVGKSVRHKIISVPKTEELLRIQGI